MKTILFLLALLSASPAFSTDAGSCYAIGSPDARAYCLAKAHKDPGRCYAIQDSATRSQCLAEVRR